MDDLRLQEDDFGDEDSDDLLNENDVESVYDGDFSFHESEVGQGGARRSTSRDVREAQPEVVQAQQYFQPSVPVGRLETIDEESRALSEAVEELEKSRCSSRERSRIAETTKTSNRRNHEDSVQFVKADSGFWKRDEENFKRGTLLERNDWRFNRTHQVKELSWEPSIVDSTPPIPNVDGDRLIRLCENVSDLRLPNEVPPPSRDAAQCTQECKEKVQPYSVEERSVIVEQENQPAPKMSTPYAERDTTRGHLHDLSRDCASISAISLAADPMTPIAARGRFASSMPPKRVAFLEPKRNLAMMPVVDEEKSFLSSSAIDRALSEASVETMNDTALIAALNKARKRTEGIFKVPDLPGYRHRIQGNLTTTHNRKPHDRAAEALRSNTVIGNGQQTEANDLMMTLGSKDLTKGSPAGSRVLQKNNSENILTGGGDAPVEGGSRVSQPTKGYRKEIVNMTAPSNRQHFDSKASRAVPSASSSFNCPSSASSRGGDSKYCLGCDTSAVWFGCAEVDSLVTQTVRLTNMLNTSLFLTISLQSKNEAFQLKETGSIMLKRKEEFFLHITFKPPAAAFYKNVIRIAVRNIERASYSIPVAGAGGTAVLVVQEHGDMSRMRDGSFVLTTSNAITVPVELANVGVRDAFALISVIDPNTKQPMEGVKVLPTDRAVILRRQKQRFEIHVEEPLCDANTETRSAFGSTNSLYSRTYYVIRIIWAEELLRYRLKRAEEAGQHEWDIDGYSFTRSKFLNEEKAKITAACNGPYGIADKDTFECRLRVHCISVADNKRVPIWQNGSLQRGQDEGRVHVLEPDATLAPDTTIGIIQDVSIMTPMAKR